MFLEQCILFMMQDKMRADGKMEKLHMEEVHRLDREIKEQKEKKNLLLAQIEKIKQQNFEAYQNYVSGKTDRFHSDQVMVKSMENELANLNKIVQKMEAVYNNMVCERESLSVGNRFAELSKEMIECYIDKIVVHDGQHIEIFWKNQVSVA